MSWFRDIATPFGLFTVGAFALGAFAVTATLIPYDDSNAPPEAEWAESDIDDFWERQAASFGFDYHDPHKVEYYTQEYGTPCGDTIENNAFFCSADHSIYLDREFLERQYEDVGRYSPAYILAHEWGHLIQADLGILESPNFSIQVELQADCFAGAYTRDLDDRDERFEDEDLRVATETLIQVGDPEHYPWFVPGAHGDANQRVDAFNTGYDGGFEACTAPPFAQIR